MDDLATALAELAPAVDTQAELARFHDRRRRHRRWRRMGAALAVVAVVGAAVIVAGASGSDPKSTVVAGVDETSTTEPTEPTGLLPGRDFTVQASVAGSLDSLGSLRSASTQQEVESLQRVIGLATDIRLRDDQVVVSMTIADGGCPDELVSFDRSGDVLTPRFRPGGTGCENPVTPVAIVVTLDRLEPLRPSFIVRLPADPPNYAESRLRITVPIAAAPSTTTTTSPPAECEPDPSVPARITATDRLETTVSSDLPRIYGPPPADAVPAISADAALTGAIKVVGDPHLPVRAVLATLTWVGQPTRLVWLLMTTQRLVSYGPGPGPSDRSSTTRPEAPCGPSMSIVDATTGQNVALVSGVTIP